MTDILSGVATVATVAAATITASNLSTRITGYGFVVFTVGSIAWFGLGLATGPPALAWTNAVLTALNLFGVWRWLGRQARVEDGSKAAAQASEATPGEALFPVSLLGRAKLLSGDQELATCVDAMAGCESGRIAYVTVSEGGIAGAGETLRRISWSKVQVAGEIVSTALAPPQFRALEPIPRDQWPAR